MINVIIPAFECESTLGRTLSSLVAQTDNNFEVIVVDDCSTQDIKKIIDKYANDLKIIYVRNEKNLGCGMSRQVGIDNATQKFITFLDSDDMLMPYAVETFNSIIEANSNTEMVHSYFYEQTVIDGNPAMVLRKDGFTWCHGKLYDVELIKKFDIKNSPLIRWADDSYFNSMCSELMNMSIIKIPTMLWCNNKNSVMRKVDSERDKAVMKDFFTAMIMSINHVKKYKNHIEHLDKTLSNFKNIPLNEEEQKMLDKILSYKE